jgi:ABC-type polysaccharide transport system permease subunit
MRIQCTGSTRTISRMRRSHTCTLAIQVWHLLFFFVGPLNFMSTLSSLRSSLWHYNRCQLWPKYDSNVVLDLLQRKIWRDNFMNMAMNGGKIHFYLHFRHFPQMTFNPNIAKTAPYSSIVELYDRASSKHLGNIF